MILATGSVLDPLYRALGEVLAWFYGIIPSYGVSIILLTITVRLVLFPLTTKQAKSMQAMQKVQPEIKRLQAKYKNDRQKLNEEMMKFYKEHQINPLAGCLPLILQMPLFIVLYRLIHDLTPRSHSVAALAKYHPKHIPVSSDLYHALKASGGKMVSWGIDLGKKAGEVKGFGDAWPYYLLVALVVATGYFQQKQMTARQPAGAANQQAQMIGRIFPIFFGVISLSIPAGVVIYFITSNLWQIAQQAWIFRKQAPTGATPAKSAPIAPAAPTAAADPPPKPSPPRSSQRRRHKRRGR